MGMELGCIISPPNYTTYRINGDKVHWLGNRHRGYRTTHRGVKVEIIDGEITTDKHHRVVLSNDSHWDDYPNIILVSLDDARTPHELATSIHRAELLDEHQAIFPKGRYFLNRVCRRCGESISLNQVDRDIFILAPGTIVSLPSPSVMKSGRHIPKSGDKCIIIQSTCSCCT